MWKFSWPLPFFFSRCFCSGNFLPFSFSSIAILIKVLFLPFAVHHDGFRSVGSFLVKCSGFGRPWIFPCTIWACKWTGFVFYLYHLWQILKNAWEIVMYVQNLNRIWTTHSHETATSHFTYLKTYKLSLTLTHWLTDGVREREEDQRA